MQAALPGVPELESDVRARIVLALGHGATRLFRNNVALAWVSSIVIRITQKKTVLLLPGDVVLRGARPLHAGLCPGSSDDIGWTSVIVTPAMVGRRLAVFTAVESKALKGRASTEQKNFLEAVNLAGGIGILARSAEEALAAMMRVTRAWASPA